LGVIGPRASFAESDENPDEAAPPPGTPIFVELPPFDIPVILGTAVSKSVFVRLTLELEDGQSKSVIEPKKTLLIDAIYKELYVLFAQRNTAVRVSDDATMRVRLLKVTSRILGDGVVHAVLIQQLYEQEWPK
jgi:hypothetical protein